MRLSREQKIKYWVDCPECKEEDAQTLECDYLAELDDRIFSHINNQQKEGYTSGELIEEFSLPNGKEVKFNGWWEIDTKTC